MPSFLRIHYFDHIHEVQISYCSEQIAESLVIPYNQGARTLTVRTGTIGQAPRKC